LIQAVCLPYYGTVMARKLRVQFEGAIYHVTIRGVERRRIFDDAAEPPSSA